MVPIKVVIHGASGRVGNILIKTLPSVPEVELVGAVDIKTQGDRLVLADGSSVPFSSDLEQILTLTKPEVVIDFSIANAVLPVVRASAQHGINVVIGTTGLTADNISEIDKLSRENKIGVIIASNFAIGAVLMMYFAKLAAKYMDYAEIIELHHDQKIDAPSGTAFNTARAMADYRGIPFSKTADAGRNYQSRGVDIQGVHVHSVRLPGLMAHQEVILGGSGQTLTIKHDTINRECYVPGVVLAVRQVVKLKGLIQGLDRLMSLG